MNKHNKIILYIFIFIVAIILVIGFYKFFILGQKDFGLKYDYYYCQNNIYYTYPKGFTDAGITYYNQKGEELISCASWGILEGKCKEIDELAGTCKKR